MPKEWSGERLETFVYNITAIEHLHRYALACSISKDKDVLDIACGEGYGSNLLAKSALSVVGVDIEKEVIDKAIIKYSRKNLSFKTGSASQIPLNNQSVDMVVSFETIEHHDEHDQMLLEIKRVLRPGGILILSSPEKKYYSDIPGWVNPYHVKELYLKELNELTAKYFANVSFLFQRAKNDSVIIQENQLKLFTTFSGDYTFLDSTKDFEGLFNICIASDGALPGVKSSIYGGNLISEFMQANIEKEIKNSWSYKIGNTLLLPLKMLKRKYHKKRN